MCIRDRHDFEAERRNRTAAGSPTTRAGTRGHAIGCAELLAFLGPDPRVDLVLNHLEIVFHHHADHLWEADLWFPAELFPGLGCVTDEQVDLRRPYETLVDLDVFLPVQPHMVESDLHQFLH